MKKAIDKIRAELIGGFCIDDDYNFWSESQGIYSKISSMRQFKMRQRSLRVVVLRGLFLRSLSMVELEI